MPVTTTTDENTTILRFDSGLSEIPRKAYNEGLQSLRMKAFMGERTAADRLLYWLLKDCGAFPSEEEKE